MTRNVIGIALILSSVLITSSVAGRTLGPEDDDSGNNHDLTFENISNVTGLTDKYRNGILIDSLTTRAFSEDPAFDLVGADASLFMVVEDSDESYDLEIEIEDGAGGTDGFYSLSVADDIASFSYRSSGPNINTCSLVFPSSGQTASIWATIEPGTLVSDTEVKIGGYANGSQQADQTCSFAPEPSTGVFDVFQINDLVSTGDVTEVRIWDSVITPFTLNRLSNPSNPSFQFEPQGDEIGVYYLENITIGELEDPNEAYLHVVAPNTVTEDTPIDVNVFASNATGFPVQINSTPQLHVTRITGDGIEFWNTSSLQWQSGRHATPMTESLADVNLWDLTVTPEGTQTLNVYATARLSVTNGEVLTANLTGDTSIEQVGADVPVEIAGLDASALIHLGIAGIFFLVAAWEGWIFPMVVGLIGTPAPIFQAQGVSYPIGFQAFVLLALMAIVLQVFAVRSKLGDGQGQTI